MSLPTPSCAVGVASIREIPKVYNANILVHIFSLTRNILNVKSEFKCQE